MITNFFDSSLSNYWVKIKDTKQLLRNNHRHYIIRETLSQSIKFEIAKRKAYTKLKLRESEDRVKRGQCALTHRMNSMLC